MNNFGKVLAALYAGEVLRYTNAQSDTLRGSVQYFKMEDGNIFHLEFNEWRLCKNDLNTDPSRWEISSDPSVSKQSMAPRAYAYWTKVGYRNMIVHYDELINHETPLIRAEDFDIFPHRLMAKNV